MAKEKFYTPEELQKEGRKRFSNDTEKKKQKRLKRAGKHPLLFGIIYLWHYFRVKSAPFHKLILQIALEFLRIVIAAPRGHAKSVLLSLVYPLWCICFKKKKFIVLVSDTQSQANEFGEAIRIELEQNEKIRNDFGDLVGKRKWTEGNFVTKTGIKVLCKGTGSQLRGLRYFFMRPDLVICDDLENDELVNTAEQRKKTENWVKKSLSNIIDPDNGQIIFVGTIIHYSGLLKKLLKNAAYKSLFFKAIQDDGTALWEALWPLSKLLKKKEEIGSIAFEAEFQNNPIDPEAQVFKLEWIEAHYYEDKDIEGMVMDKYAAVDPALSEKETADFTAMPTIGIAQEGEYKGHIFVLDDYQVRLSPKKFIDKLFDKFRAFNHFSIGFEINNFQSVYKKWIDDKSTENRIYIPTVPLDNRGDKVRRITRLSPLFENGIIHLKKSQIRLIEQLIYFPKADHDDGPDALEMAVRIAREYGIFFEQIEEPVNEGEFMLEVA